MSGKYINIASLFEYNKKLKDKNKAMNFKYLDKELVKYSIYKYQKNELNINSPIDNINKMYKINGLY